MKSNQSNARACCNCTIGDHLQSDKQKVFICCEQGSHLRGYTPSYDPSSPPSSSSGTSFQPTAFDPASALDGTIPNMLWLRSGSEMALAFLELGLQNRWTRCTSSQLKSPRTTLVQSTFVEPVEPHNVVFGKTFTSLSAAATVCDSYFFPRVMRGALVGGELLQ